MRTKEIEVLPGLTAVTVTESFERKLKSAFYAERDSTIKEIQSIAKKAKLTSFQVYAEMLFQKALEARFEYAKSKQEKVLQGAVGVLIAAGMTEEDAKKRLGLTDVSA